MVRFSLFVATTLACLTVAGAEAAATRMLATEVAQGSLAGAQGTLAWSTYHDGGTFRLATWRAGVVSEPPIAGSPVPLDVAAGAGRDGRLRFTWSRCERPLSLAGCDIVLFDPTQPAAGEVQVGFASRRGADERLPAIDAGRLAWARTANDSTMASVVVRRLDGRGRTRTFRVGPRRFATALVGPGTPAERTVTRLTITGLALRGETLAVAGRAATRTGSPGVCGQSFVRLVSLTTGRQRQIAGATCGASGASFPAPAFDPQGRVWFVRACNADQSACQGGLGLPRRFDPRTGRTATLNAEVWAVSSLAMLGSELVLNDQPMLVNGCLFAHPGWALGICGQLRLIERAALPEKRAA